MSQQRPESTKCNCRAVDAGGAAIVLALSALFYVTVVQPVMNQRHAAGTLAVRAAVSEQQAAALQVELQSTAAKLAEMRGGVSGPTLEPVSALNRRLARIASLAAAHRLDLTAVHPAPAAPLSKYLAIPISLAGTGTFRHCVEFLHDLHEQLPDVSATAVNLNAAPSAHDSAPVANFQLELRWYATAQVPAQGSASAIQ